MPLLAGSREEETRAQQEEAGQEVSGSSAGGFLSFARSCSHAGVPTVRFLEVICVARSEAWAADRSPRGQAIATVQPVWGFYSLTGPTALPQNTRHFSSPLSPKPKEQRILSIVTA